MDIAESNWLFALPVETLTVAVAVVVVSIVVVSMTSPLKQPPYQPHKTQCLTLTLILRYNAIVNESGLLLPNVSKKSLLYYNICLKNAIVIQYLVKKSHFNDNVAK